MATYLIELYASRGTTRAAKRIAAAIATTGKELRYLRTILVPDDEICFCLIEAPSVAALAELAETAHVELDRIVEAILD
jgi:hypothetical protein